MSEQDTKLVFVYQADSGLFNTVTDIAHKIFSPQTYNCKLCAITHSYFSVRDQWTEFVKELPVECDFLHRDEFAKQYPTVKHELPAVFIQGEGELNIFIASNEINTCNTLNELEELIRTRIDTVLTR